MLMAGDGLTKEVDLCTTNSDDNPLFLLSSLIKSTNGQFFGHTRWFVMCDSVKHVRQVSHLIEDSHGAT